MILVRCSDSRKALDQHAYGRDASVEPRGQAGTPCAGRSGALGPRAGLDSVGRRGTMRLGASTSSVERPRLPTPAACQPPFKNVSPRPAGSSERSKTQEKCYVDLRNRGTIPAKYVDLRTLREIRRPIPILAWTLRNLPGPLNRGRHGAAEPSFRNG